MEIIVFDGDDTTSPQIKPPDGKQLKCISIRMLHIEDETRLKIVLAFPKLDGMYPCIRLPRQLLLGIIAEFGLEKITVSLTAFKILRHTALGCGNLSRVFTDYGKHVTYACVGPQPSQNLNTVQSHPPCMQAAPDSHWMTLVWMMKRAESSFHLVANHLVLSHLHRAKKLVPFETFTMARPDNPLTLNAQFFGGGRMFFFIATLMLISR